MEDVFGIFLDALRQIFSETGIEIACFGDNDGIGIVQVITNIGITGDLRGNLQLETNHESAGRILRTMLGDIGSKAEPEGLAEIRKASLCEITNQIAGRAITLLSTLGIDCDITPPTIITADAVAVQAPLTGMNARRATRGPFGELVLTLAVEEAAERS